MPPRLQQVWRAAQVAKIMGVSPRLLTRLERAGFIPQAPRFGGQRHYTRANIQAMAALVGHCKENPGRWHCKPDLQDTEDLGRVAREEWLNDDGEG